MEEKQGNLKIIGDCPVCGKGKLVEGTRGYMCNHFKSLDDKCSFTIFNSYFGKEITEEIAVQLIENGETEIFNDLHKKDGGIFSASLTIEDGFVKPKFQNKIMSYKCPFCDADVEELANGYACVNYNTKNENEERECGFYVPKTICNYHLSEKDITDIVENGETAFKEDAFTSKAGNLFSSKLVLNEADGQLQFSNVICLCPKCGNGEIYSSTKAYNCSNFKDEAIKCDFVVWKQISGRDIKVDEVIALCQNKVTSVLKGFRSKEKGEFSAKLSLNDDCKVIMI
jgi:hypothetical protein